MSKPIAARVAVCLLLALCVGLPGTRGRGTDPGKTAKPVGAPGAKRITYVVKYAASNHLATVLTKQFKGEVEVEALSDPLGDCLLISAPAALSGEIVPLLARLDRRPQSVAVEILVAEVARRPDPDKPDPADKELEPKQFSGPAAEVLAKLKSLCDDGRIGTLRRARVVVPEGRSSTIGLLESKPFVTSINMLPGGHVSRNYRHHAIGISAIFTAHVSADRKIEIDLQATTSRYEPNDTVVLGKDENGVPVMATDIISARFAGRLTVASGRAEAADGVKTSSNSGRMQTLIVVTATLADPDAKPEKEDEIPWPPSPSRPARPARPARPGPG